jgi:sugar phosphate isomerase/epimerase
MNSSFSETTRRTFLKSMAVSGAGIAAGALFSPSASAAAARRNIKLGYDNFSVRAWKWKAAQLIDFAAEMKTDSLFITDLDAFESLEEKHLKEIRARATDKGLQIHLGTWSICPTSKSFKKNWGTAEEHLALSIRSAKALGSPVIRAVLGSAADRMTEGGIEARIADTVKVCKALRSQAMDAGVKIAIENHAGDMQAWELATLVEAAGTDYVGVNLDSGNAAWTVEDPLESLEILGKYTITTSLRDTAVWETPEGAKVQWVAMGDGSVNWKSFLDRFAQLCPGVPVHIENISGGPRDLPYFKREFWNPYPKARGRDFARFLAWAKTGKQVQPPKMPTGVERSVADQQFQKSDIERSIRYCQEELGLGLKS